MIEIENYFLQLLISTINNNCIKNNTLNITPHPHLYNTFAQCGLLYKPFINKNLLLFFLSKIKP